MQRGDETEVSWLTWPGYKVGFWPGWVCSQACNLHCQVDGQATEIMIRGVPVATKDTFYKCIFSFNNGFITTTIPVPFLTSGGSKISTNQSITQHAHSCWFLLDDFWSPNFNYCGIFSQIVWLLVVYIPSSNLCVTDCICELSVYFPNITHKKLKYKCLWRMWDYVESFVPVIHLCQMFG